jgi:hypothetical protein
MLVVVEHGNLHALAAFTLDDKAIRRLDVFQIDPAEGWLKRSNYVHQLMWIRLVELDVEHVDACEFLEQHRFAFHYWLRCKRPNVTQPKHRRSIRDHADEVAASREARGI